MNEILRNAIELNMNIYLQFMFDLADTDVTFCFRAFEKRWNSTSNSQYWKEMAGNCRRQFIIVDSTNTCRKSW